MSCTSLRMFELSVILVCAQQSLFQCSQTSMSSGSNLWLSVINRSIHSALTTAEKVSLDFCLMLQEPDRPDFLEAWASALRQNYRIRYFRMIGIGFDRQDPKGVDEFVEALTTRSTLEYISLYGGHDPSGYSCFEWKWKVSHMSKIGGMGNLRYLWIQGKKPNSGLLQALLAPHPSSLRELNVENSIVISESHFHELLNFLSDLSTCLLYTSPSPRDLSTSRMPSSA